MPYIDRRQRHRLDHESVYDVAPTNVGELTYVLYRTIYNYWWRRGEGRYQQIAEIRAALDGAKTEFDHNIARPYEDRKAAENGGVT